MAGNTAILAIKILGDSQDAQRALAQVEQSTQQAENATKKSGKNMAGVWATVGAALLGVVKASSMTESATVALNTVFGEQGDEMIAWAEGMAQYGLSTAQAGAAAAVLGVQLEAVGLSTEQTVVVTQKLVETSAALAQVLGGSAAEAAQAMGAALRGEYDSLERYGITLTADKVAAEAMALAQQGVVFASEEQAKAVATLSLIQQGATAILKDAEEGTITMASATDHLKASVFNLAGTIGDVLTPILGPLIESVADVTDKLGQQIANSELLADVSAALAEVLGMVTEILSPLLSEVLQTVSGLLQVMYDILAPFLVPIVNALAAALDLVADALAVVIGWVNSAIAAFEHFIEVVREAIDALTFWNDTYTASPPPTAMMAGVAGYARGGVARIPRAAAPVNITVNTGIGDPHAIAQQIRRVLQRDEARLGRRTEGFAR